MYDSAFTPGGPTVLVGVVPVQVPATGSVIPTSYRVVSKNGALAYIGWIPGVPGTAAVPAAFTVAAPTAGTPSVNTLGMQANSVETFSLPANAWFQASAGATFEVTPGEGQ